MISKKDQRTLKHELDMALEAPLKGSRQSKRLHRKRALQIAVAIFEDNEKRPSTWQAKDVRRYLEHSTKHLAPSTRYAHWLTMRAVVLGLNKWKHWEVYLSGPWMFPDGVMRGRGVGGRPPALNKAEFDTDPEQP